MDLGDGNSLFGVFDGHGGLEVSNFIKNKFVPTLLGTNQYQNGKFAEALSQTFKLVEEMLKTDEAER